MSSSEASDADRVRRWEQAGGIWRVLSRSSAGVTVSLQRCDGGEQVDQITSTDQRLIAYLGERSSSEDDH